MSEPTEFQKDRMRVKVYPTRDSMGREAAKHAAVYIRHLLAEKSYVNLLFASAPSQNEFLAALTEERGISWKRVNAFHEDEYIGIAADAPQSFRSYLRKHVADKVELHDVHYINGNAEDPEEECRRYSKLLAENPIDLVFLGIGENGHIAFNDPHIADIKDSKLVRIVEELDIKGRQQQVNEGNFESLDQVPVRAITVTIPVIMAAQHAIAMVPGAYKARIIQRVVTDTVGADCPGSLLRQHANAVLYLDREAASLIDFDVLAAAG